MTPSSPAMYNAAAPAAGGGRLLALPPLSNAPETAPAPPKAAETTSSDALGANAKIRAIADALNADQADKQVARVEAGRAAFEEATRPVGERIIDEAQAGPVSVAKGGGVGGEDRLVRGSASLTEGPASATPADPAAGVAEQAEKSESANKTVQSEAAKAYEAERALAERETELVEQRKSPLNVFA